jgi:REP element-mobilizing transposase RayT
VFTSEHLTLLAEVFADVCADFGAMLTECNGEDDHVHLLIEYPPTVQLSKLVNSLKGVSSRRLGTDIGYERTATISGRRRTSPGPVVVHR